MDDVLSPSGRAERPGHAWKALDGSYGSVWEEYIGVSSYTAARHVELGTTQVSVKWKRSGMSCQPIKIYSGDCSSLKGSQ